MNTNVLPLFPQSNTPVNALKFGNVKAKQTEIQFEGANKSSKPTIYDDPMGIDFDVPVTPDSVRQLKATLLKLSAAKEQLGGTVKIFLSSPGGQVDAGNRIMDLISQLRVPVDTIIDGGTAASMAGFLFLAGDRRIMTPNARIMVHPPNITLPGNMPFSEPDLRNMAKEINRTRVKGEHYIAKRTGLSKDEASELMNTENYLDPLKALKMGFATHLLVEDGALTKDSIKSLSDEEIDRRDVTQDYDGLELFDFDPGLTDPNRVAQLQAQQQRQMAMQAQQRAMQGAGQRPQGPSDSPQGSEQQLDDIIERPTVAASNSNSYQIVWPEAPKIDFEA